VFDELNQVLGDEKDFPDYSDIEKRMPFLSACTKEALRLHTSSPLLFRMANNDTSIGPYKIAEGSGVIMSTEWLGKDPKYWQQANIFCPTRHLSMEDDKIQQEDNEDVQQGNEGTPNQGNLRMVKTPDSFSLLPFGAGNHACLGSRLGFVMTISVVSMLLRALQLEEMMYTQVNAKSGENNEDSIVESMKRQDKTIKEKIII